MLLFKILSDSFTNTQFINEEAKEESSYERVSVITLRQIVLFVLVRQKYRNFITNVTTNTVATAIGNKGATAISFMYKETSVCFICTHLTSGHENLQKRFDDYKRILEELRLEQKVDIFAHFDHIIWFGDVNKYTYNLD
jgi:hypothetical protein